MFWGLELSGYLAIKVHLVINTVQQLLFEVREVNMLRLFEVAEKEIDEGGELKGVVLLLNQGKRLLQLGQLLL